MSRLRLRHGRARGQSLVLFALFAFVLLGFSALAIDYGTWLLSRRDYQNAADSAALAGSPHMTSPSTEAGRTAARQAAWQSLRSQLGLSLLDPAAQGLGNTTAGSPYTENGYRLWVDSPANAAGAKYPGGYGASPTVFVRVERDNSSFFGQAVGQGSKNVGAWATAGLWSNRFAIVMLCGQNNNAEGIRCPSSVRGLKIGGTTSGVTVTNGGDVGSNYGLTVTSSSGPGLLLQGGGSAYLVDLTCGSSTYLCQTASGLTGGIQDGTNRLGGLPAPEIVDPNYAEPSWLSVPVTNGPTTQVPNRCKNNGGNPVACTGNTSISATTGGTVVNGSSTSIACGGTPYVLGPGTYDNVTVPSSTCVILDPKAGLTAGQQPGIFRFRGTLDIRSSSAVIGDGVSVFFDRTAGLNVGNGGAIVLNTGNAPGHTGQDWSYAAWTSQAATPWTVCANSGACTRTDSDYNRNIAGRGMPIYVRKASGVTTSIINMSGGSGILLRGIVYAPHDNVGISGSSGQSSAGKIVAWSIVYSGNTSLQQTYEDENVVPKPYLIEPRLGQP